METQIISATDYRNVPLSLLNESKTNPRRIFDDAPCGNWPKAFALMASFRHCWYVLSPRTASRLSRGRDDSAPLRSRRSRLCPSASWS